MQLSNSITICQKKFLSQTDWEMVHPFISTRLLLYLQDYPNHQLDNFSLFEINWLPLQYRNAFKMLLFVPKALSGLTPSTSRTLRPLRSSGAGL